MDKSREELQKEYDFTTAKLEQAVVKSRLLKLDREHILSVFDCSKSMFRKCIDFSEKIL